MWGILQTLNIGMIVVLTQLNPCERTRTIYLSIPGSNQVKSVFFLLMLHKFQCTWKYSYILPAWGLNQICDKFHGLSQVINGPRYLIKYTLTYWYMLYSHGSTYKLHASICYIHTFSPQNTCLEIITLVADIKMAVANKWMTLNPSRHPSYLLSANCKLSHN